MVSNEKAWAIVKAGAAAEAVRFEEGFGPIEALCESPIEALLLAKLYSSKNLWVQNIVFFVSQTIPARVHCDETAYVCQQVKIGPYRVDILIVDATLPFDLGAPRFIVVECDGHDFHERTKEQARRDKKRDRFLQRRGFRVLRFTGSEIWSDPEACVDEIIENLAANQMGQD